MPADKKNAGPKKTVTKKNKIDELFQARKHDVINIQAHNNRKIL